MRQFTQWIGFLAARQMPNPELQATYRKLEQKVMADVMAGVEL
jgi:hypothetical protein